MDNLPASSPYLPEGDRQAPGTMCAPHEKPEGGWAVRDGLLQDQAVLAIRTHSLSPPFVVRLHGAKQGEVEGCVVELGSYCSKMVVRRTAAECVWRGEMEGDGAGEM